MSELPARKPDAARDSVHANIKQASWSFGAKLLALFIRFIRNIIVARILGPAERGVLAVLMAIPELFATLGAGGLTGSASYFGAKTSDDRSFAPTLLLFCAIGGVLIGAAVLLLFAQPAFFKGYHETAAPYAALVCIVAGLFVTKLALSGLFTGMGAVAAFNILRVSESAIPLIVFLGLWALGMEPLRAALLAWAAAYVVINLGATIYLAKQGALAGKIHLRAMRAIGSFSMRNHVDRAAQIILLRSDYFFLSYFSGAAAAGYYAIATIGAELLLSLSEAVNVPLTRRLFRNSDAPRIDVAITVGRLLFAATFAGAIILCLLSRPAIEIAFGEAFAPAAPALVWLTPGVVALATGSVFRLALLGDDRPGLVSAITAIASGLCLILNFILIPRYGVVGAAMASSSSYSLMAVAFIGAALAQSGRTPASLFLVTLAEKKFWSALLSGLKNKYT